ncbi:MAG: 30S ribosomal protein S12 methylthiotransferase RimO [Bacteroidales bacterium]
MDNLKKINVITLGCSKNLVDSEYLMKQLDGGGWKIVFDSNDPSAKVVIVNTCGFIADAKEESIFSIISLIEAKQRGAIDKIFVMGCLSQRYKEDLMKELPEVDGFFGVNELPDILKALNTDLSESNLNRRLLTTPKHYAYLKISEGCSWGCSFCAIPLIRGKHLSKSIPELIDQAEWLADNGVKELIIIAQDSTYYGKDIYGERRLPELLGKLSQISGIEWVRLHYAYPTGFPMELLNIIRDNPKVCSYIDIPFQHISDKVLKMMRRGITKNQTLYLIKKIRSTIPDVAIRTTLLVGHPGEGEEEFNELIDFVKTSRFERLGVFAYSEEEGTHSATFADDVPEDIKQERVEKIMSIQRDISLEKNRSRIGKRLKVIIDREEGEFFVGRSEFDSPEVDQEILIKKCLGRTFAPGDFVTCTIDSADDYDLYGSEVNE